jgi:calcineurin-like phosphoesterase family protein
MSGRIYLISDLHLGHKNMAIRRGFSCIEDHDKHIIDSWNSVVDKHDTVYILGDITMETKQHYPLLSKLKGFKKIIGGNHDKPQHVPELLKYVNSFCAMFKYKDSIFTHCPIHESELRRFKYNYHGHVHMNTINDDRYINVCAEYINYKPIEFIR